MSVLKSVHKPGISCNHKWADTYKNNQECDRCGSVCERDESGQIVHYTHPAFREPSFKEYNSYVKR